MTDAARPRRFVGRKNFTDSGQTSSELVKPKPKGRPINQIPDDILNDQELNNAIKILPANYNFEIHKTIWNIRKSNAKRIALQMPEGLLIYSCVISDIIQQFCPGTDTVIMGDVTYGACCIDDFTATALDCDFLVHYAHSCLVPVDVTRIKVLYVFVTIDIDRPHLINTVARHFKPGSKLAMVSTIQFNHILHAVHNDLLLKEISTVIPQAMPLSRGEVLGCTSARLTSKSHHDDDSGYDAIVYIGDGRFHLESAMIHNPELPAYKYDPYSRKFTIEKYDHDEMYSLRREAISKARSANKIGIILGSLGRQGNVGTLERIQNGFKQQKNIESVVVLLSEIFPGKLAQFPDVDCWVQVACPRLSIDWGYAFPRPLLTPYEAMVALDLDDDWSSIDGGAYPMDYYSKDGYGRGNKPARIRT